MATTQRFTASLLVKILLFSILIVYIVRLVFYCSQPKVYFLLSTGTPVVYKTLSSNTPWDSFLESAKSATPLQYRDHTGGKLHNTAKAVVVNHPWCARWWLADQLALGSLPHYLTKSMRIISSTGSWKNPRTMVLKKLQKDRVIFVDSKGSGQYAKMEHAVRLVKESNTTLLVYPEGSHSLLYGHRDSPPTLAPFKTGIFRAIYKLDIPVIPVVLPLEWQPKTNNSTLKIEILPPVYPRSHPSCQEFVDSVYAAMIYQIHENKRAHA